MDSSGRRFRARLSEFETIASHIDDACAAMRQDERLRIVLLVEELFANSVNHGYGGDSDHPVWLTLDPTPGKCRVVYEDCAPEYDPFASVDASSTEADLDARPVGGLGLVLLTEMSSHRSYARCDDRNVIVLEIPCTTERDS